MPKQLWMNLTACLIVMILFKWEAKIIAGISNGVNPMV